MNAAARRAIAVLAVVVAAMVVAAGCGDDESKDAPRGPAPTRATDPASSGDSVAGDVERDRAVDAAASYDAQAAPIIVALLPVARRVGAVAATGGRSTPLAAVRRQAAAARALALRVRAIDTADQPLLDASGPLADGIDSLADTFDVLATLATTPAAGRDDVLVRAGASFDAFTLATATWNDALDVDGRDFPRSSTANDRLGDVLAGLELG